jgi:alpha-beta hydrolase superfamily lysophospholipase
MSSFHLVNVWTEPEPGPGGFNPMATSLLWLPDDHDVGQPQPAFVFAHRWGGYPHDPLPKSLGPLLADRGFVFLSLCLRRRGMEGQLQAMPDDDLRDLKLAVDYLHTNGCNGVFLVGEEVGALSALRYQARHRDTRVQGVALIDPVDDLDVWLRDALGAEAFGEALRKAGVAARQGRGMDYRIDLFPASGPAVTMQAGAFLAWWSAMADTKLSRSLADTMCPLLVMAGHQGELPQPLREAPPPGCRVECGAVAPETCAAQLDEWAVSLGARKLERSNIELVAAVSQGRELYGLLWRPAGRQPQTAILLMHGLTGGPSSALFGKMGPVLANAGFAALAIESHRSGWAGHEAALASMGSLSIGRYQSIRQHPKVVALAHLMPTADCPDWFRRGVGEQAYREMAERAERAVAQGEGASFLVDIDMRQPPPSLTGGRFRWTQRAASWLSWWGPNADSCNTVHIANARVPILLLSGTTDSYNDEARFAELRAAASQAPSVDEIWYEDIDHGLAGAEERTANDLCAWLAKIGVA